MNDKAAVMKHKQDQGHANFPKVGQWVKFWKSGGNIQRQSKFISQEVSNSSVGPLYTALMDNFSS